MRREHDYYPTPAWCVRALLATVDLPSGLWLEPTAGDGSIIRSVNECRGGVTWEAIEIDEAHRADLEATGAHVRIEDVLTASLSGDYRMVIGNPPYSLSERVLGRLLDEIRCPVAVLMPLSYLAGQRREGFYVRHGMPDVYLLPRRPSFVAGGTAAVEYGWMIWPERPYRSMESGGITRIRLDLCR